LGWTLRENDFASCGIEKSNWPILISFGTLTEEEEGKDMLILPIDKNFQEFKDLLQLLILHLGK
jgi:hypothetical protein